LDLEDSPTVLIIPDTPEEKIRNGKGWNHHDSKSAPTKNGESLLHKVSSSGGSRDETVSRLEPKHGALNSTGKEGGGTHHSNKPPVKPSHRSFLCPVDKLTVMPGLKPAQPTQGRVKKTARRSLGKVSVEFSSTPVERKENTDHTMKQSTLDKCGESGKAVLRSRSIKNVVGGDGVVRIESKPIEVKEIQLGENEDYTDFSFEHEATLSPMATSDTVDKTEDDEGEAELEKSTACLTVCDEEESRNSIRSRIENSDSPGKTSIAVDDEDDGEMEVEQFSLDVATPTKSTADGKMKRMAQPGISPDPKRLVAADTEETISNLALESTRGQRAIKARRQLATIGGFRDVKAMDQSVNSYQLGVGNLGNRQTDVSVAGDDVLSDILGQMGGDHPGVKPADDRGEEKSEFCSKSKDGPKFSFKAEDRSWAKSLSLKKNSCLSLSTDCDNSLSSIGENFTKIKEGQGQNVTPRESDVMDTCCDKDDDVLSDILRELTAQYSTSSSCGEKWTKQANKAKPHKLKQAGKGYSGCNRNSSSDGFGVSELAHKQTENRNDSTLSNHSESESSVMCRCGQGKQNCECDPVGHTPSSLHNGEVKPSLQDRSCNGEMKETLGSKVSKQTQDEKKTSNPALNVSSNNNAASATKVTSTRSYVGVCSKYSQVQSSTCAKDISASLEEELMGSFDDSSPLHQSLSR
jgi:hypothetical protein